MSTLEQFRRLALHAPPTRGAESTQTGLQSVVRFAFHQIVLANSIQNLPFISKLTEPFFRISKNHFRTPIFGTTRLARRAAAHQYCAPRAIASRGAAVLMRKASRGAKNRGR